MEEEKVLRELRAMLGLQENLEGIQNDNGRHSDVLIEPEIGSPVSRTVETLVANRHVGDSSHTVVVERGALITSPSVTPFNERHVVPPTYHSENSGSVHYPSLSHPPAYQSTVASSRTDQWPNSEDSSAYILYNMNRNSSDMPQSPSTQSARQFNYPVGQVQPHPESQTFSYPPSISLPPRLPNISTGSVLSQSMEFLRPPPTNFPTSPSETSMFFDRLRHSLNSSTSTTATPQESALDISCGTAYSSTSTIPTALSGSFGSGSSMTTLDQSYDSIGDRRYKKRQREFAAQSFSYPVTSMNKSARIEHMPIHAYPGEAIQPMSTEEDRQYVCLLCNVKFKRIYDLRRHEAGHNPDRPYGCDLCGRRLACLLDQIFWCFALI
ncbi:hypothetical protein BKA69DRAFT_1062764 [Paraphysoderma sedebokerense]|nr:hypothetical protein BKA69DRAFT_1062764 [Paraphysoderma sedebokerense]